jgi:GTPase SAR1 family protein
MCFELYSSSLYSYEALENWYHALQDANSRKGSALLPKIIVGSNLNLQKHRSVKVKEVEVARSKYMAYLEVSSKAKYKTKEFLLGLVKVLSG